MVNESVVSGADENCRNPSSEVKRQHYLLKDYLNCWCIDWAGEEDLKMLEGPTLGTEETGIYHFFLVLPNYSEKFYIKALHQCPTIFRQISDRFKTSFQTNHKSQNNV